MIKQLTSPKALALACALAATALVAPMQALAGTYSVFVGYSDGLRTGAFFPNPWDGDAGIQFFGVPINLRFQSTAISVESMS